MQMQHHGGLDQPAVQAVRQFVGRDQAVGQAELKAGHARDQHTMRSAQALRDEVDDLRLSAVAVEDHQLA